MKNVIRICLVLLLIFLLNFTLQAQQPFAKLEKNRNIQAKGLIHKLNKTRDTLILQGDKKINYLYSINKAYSRDIDITVDSNSFKLPLNKLSKGKHVMVAVQSPMQIVFVIKILEDIPLVKSSEIISEDIKVAEPVRVVHINND